MPIEPLVELELWSKGDWPRREVVGESFHGDALRSLFPKQLPNGGQECLVRAALVPDPSNRHDRNAIKVVVEGKHVGHLSAEDAAVYQPVLQALVQRGFLPVTSARIWGSEYETYDGVDRRGRDIMRRVFHASVSVTLDEWHLCVPMNQPSPMPHVMLPFGSALQARKEEDHQDVLRRYVNRHGECWVYGTLHPITEETARTSRELVEVRIDGQRVGELTPAMSAEFIPIIRQLAERDRATGVRLIVKGNQVKADVVLYAKKASQLDDAWLAAHVQRQPHVAVPAVQAQPVPEPPVRDHRLVTPTSHRPIPSRPSRVVFVAPPGWPPAPTGWEPAPDWQPDPSWPPAPDSWQFWQLAP